MSSTIGLTCVDFGFHGNTHGKVSLSEKGDNKLTSNFGQGGQIKAAFHKVLSGNTLYFFLQKQGKEKL